VTILPPANGAARDTVPPEMSSDSTVPPADLGPTGMALRLLALEAKVDDIHAETFGISKAYHDMNNSLVGINDSLERMATAMEILRDDAQAQRLDRQRMRVELDGLEARIAGATKEEVAK